MNTKRSTLTVPVVSTLAALATLAAASPAGAQPHVHGAHEMMGWWMWGAGIFGVLFWLAVFVLIVVAIWKLFRSGREGNGGGDSALRVLRERYARGEIDREEFQQKRRDLEAR